MKKELVDYIGSLLFGTSDGAPLQLKSEKQFVVAHDGSLQREQSVLTDILVAKEAIYLTYRLPDGHTARFVNAVTDVDCEVNSDFTIGSIVYKTVDATSGKEAGKKETTLFILNCEEDRMSFFEEKDNRTCFQINE
jgi:hypothetical protein